jgi:hypothetical protein
MTHPLLVALLATLAAGCLPESDPGKLDLGPPPPSCGNATCEPALGESCLNCPKDCPCCAGVSAAGNGVHPEYAVGLANGKDFAELSEHQILEITVGREIFDQSGKTDFEIVGTVSASGASTTGCVTAMPTTGVLVKVFDDKDWRTAGAWTSGGAAFDLACAGVAHTFQVRLEALANTTARVDALKATSCNE